MFPLTETYRMAHDNTNLAFTIFVGCCCALCIIAFIIAIIEIIKINRK